VIERRAAERRPSGCAGSALRQAAVIIGLMTAAPCPAGAEWFVDLYAGGSFTQDADVKIRTEDVNVPVFNDVRVDLDQVEIDDFVAFGLRVGRWLEAVPGLGIALDVFHFGPDIPAQTVSATATANLTIEIEDKPIVIGAGASNVPIPELDLPSTAAVAAVDVMVRHPVLTSPEFPHGRLQPYLTAGPAFLLTDVDPEFTLGVKVGAGLGWQLHRHVALFGEYRFTHFSPEIETGGVVVGPVETGDLEIETDVNTHHVLAGLSFRF
jgi:opacity protein-like surface antigen